MFGLFRTPSSRILCWGSFAERAWRGEISLGEVRAPLTLPGSRAAPDTQALDIARSIPTDYPGWREGIEASIFEHYAPYAEAIAAGEIDPSEQSLNGPPAEHPR
jgi:hypothetical protein